MAKKCVEIGENPTAEYTNPHKRAILSAAPSGINGGIQNEKFTVSLVGYDLHIHLEAGHPTSAQN